jgi:hypothetical protein
MGKGKKSPGVICPLIFEFFFSPPPKNEVSKGKAHSRLIFVSPFSPSFFLASVHAGKRSSMTLR